MKDINYKQIGYFIAGIVALFILYKYIYKPNAELFSEFKFDTDRRSVVKTSAMTIDKELLSNGFVFKHDNNGSYEYIFKFNLPVPVGGDMNTINGEYLVFAGKSETQVNQIGKLKRSSDGWFYLVLETPEDYTYSQVIFKVDNETKLLFSGKI